MSNPDSKTKNLTPKLRPIFSVSQGPALMRPAVSITGHIIPIHKANYKPATLCKGVLVNRALRRTVTITNRGLPLGVFMCPSEPGLSMRLGEMLICTDPTFPPAKYDGQVLFQGPYTIRLTFLKPFTYDKSEPPYLHIDLPHLLGWRRARADEIQQAG
jgi:hypothetical protein